MESVSHENKLESLKSLQSAIRKSEKAFAQMAQKGANITLIEKRLTALQIGFAVLENVWNQKPHHYTQEDLAEAPMFSLAYFHQLEMFMLSQRQEVLKEHFWKEELKH